MIWCTRRSKESLGMKRPGRRATRRPSMKASKAFLALPRLRFLGAPDCSPFSSEEVGDMGGAVGSGSEEVAEGITGFN